MALTVNRSNEWLQVFSSIDFEDIPEEDRNDAADDFTNRLVNGLESAGFDVKMADGQKGTCHGWNGANTFVTKLGPVASYKELTEDTRCKIRGIIHRADHVMRRDWAETAE